MNVPNELAARVMGDILARGMSLSGFDIAREVKSEAIDVLCEIREAMNGSGDRANEVERILEKYGVR